VGSTWFSSEENQKGALVTGQLADIAVLTADYFSIPEEEIKGLESVLTIVGGKVVYASAEFSKLAPSTLPVSPDWSPVKHYGGYHQPTETGIEAPECVAFSATRDKAPHGAHRWVLGEAGMWELGCDCFAF
jgi:Amidohydrolase family